MKKQQILQLAEEIVQEEIRKGSLIKYKNVLSVVPSTLNATIIDSNKIHKVIENSLTSNNIFNRFFNMFGVQVINKEKTINRLVDSVSNTTDDTVENSEDSSGRLLALNSEEYAKSIACVAQQLAELEDKTTASCDAEKKRGNDLFFKHENLLNEHKELKQSVEANNQLIAQRVQYILSLKEKDSAMINEQLIELLKDINIEVYWDSEDTHLTDAAMFSEYTTTDDALTGTKPCLVNNGTVYLKGVRFIKK